jgi:replicative DNA helicase
MSMERDLVLSLYRRPGEPPDAALSRIASLPPALTADYITDESLRKQLKLILDNAWQRELSTTAVLASNVLKIDQFDLARGIAEVDPTALSVYVESVLIEHDRRGLREAARKIDSIVGSKDPREALNDAMSELSLVELSSETSRLMTVSQRSKLGRRLLAERQELLRSNAPRVAFPIADLNEMIPYLMPGWMILVTAESGIGKSSFVGQMADYNGRRGLSTAVFHFEDTPEVMDVRQIARQSWGQDGGGYSTRKMLSTVMDDEDIAATGSIRDDIELWGDTSYEFYAGGMTMESVCHAWRRLAMRGRYSGNQLRLVILDYLNKATITAAKSRTHSGLFGARGYDAELAKRTTESTGVVTVIVQQEVDNRPYETNQARQKAQVYISLRRDETARGHSESGEIKVLKANLGRTGTISVRFASDGMLWM